MSIREIINEDIQIIENGTANLETFNCGKVAQCTAICLKENAVDPPSVWGAENYTANNFNAPAANPQTGEGGIATRFMSMTSRATSKGKAFHGAGDNLAVFGSEVYSGGTGENYTTTPVGGMLVQASHQHEEEKLGTRLIFCYTKPDSDEVIPGAILDDDGTLIVGNIQVLGKLKQGENLHIINTTSLENKVETLIDALVGLGLAKRDTDQ